MTGGSGDGVGSGAGAWRVDRVGVVGGASCGTSTWHGFPFGAVPKYRRVDRLVDGGVVGGRAVSEGPGVLGGDGIWPEVAATAVDLAASLAVGAGWSFWSFGIQSLYFPGACHW